jgi:hypothetical protein
MIHKESLIYCDEKMEEMIVRLSNRTGKAEDWPAKYGSTYENDVFSLHPYCWCYDKDCPWCAYCTCPPRYFVGDQEVMFDEKWNEERTVIYDRTCDFCVNKGMPLPNFHYKPLDLRVWWYKYIGRDMQQNIAVPDLNKVLNHCLESIRKVGNHDE